MKLDIKKTAAHISSAVLGIAVVGAFGAAALTPPAEGEKITHALPEDTAAVSAECDTQDVEFLHFKKADISEYVMTSSAVAPEKKTSVKQVKSVSSFKMALPEDDTVIYDPQPEAAPCGDTRSTSDEFYTVYDIISDDIVTLDAHEMVCRMVYSEIGAEWKQDAIKAQAVAAYSYLRFNDAQGLIPTVGLKAGYPAKIENCINAVEGQCVYYNGNIIDAVYSASSAGCSLESENIWGAAYPYLRAVKSEFDSEDPNFGEETTLTKAEVKKIIESRTDIKLSDKVEKWFTADEVMSGRYIGKMSFDGHSSCKVDGKDTDISGYTMQKLFDLKSCAFTVSYEDGVFTIKSYGYGHGVGMSQWGACLYAEHGYTYDQILRHYYLGTNIALSSVNEKAVKRGKMSDDELEKEIDDSEIVDAEGNITEDKKPARPVSEEEKPLQTAEESSSEAEEATSSEESSEAETSSEVSSLVSSEMSSEEESSSEALTDESSETSDDTQLVSDSSSQ